MNDPEQRTKRPRQGVRITIRKVGGDDAYSWAVLRDGVPWMMGMSRREAQYERDRARKRLGYK